MFQLYIHIFVNVNRQSIPIIDSKTLLLLRWI